MLREVVAVGAVHSRQDSPLTGGRCVEEVARLVSGVKGEVSAGGVGCDGRAVERVTEIAARRGILGS